jgi:hypothetical protein
VFNVGESILVELFSLVLAVSLNLSPARRSYWEFARRGLGSCILFFGRSLS